MTPQISLYLLFYLILLFNVIQGQKCRSDKGCNRDLVKCGFCVEDYCHFPFINIYTPGKFCNLNRNKCNNKSCTLGSKKSAPIEGYSRCVCECSVGRYGQYCEKEGDSGVTYTSGVQLIAPTVVEWLKDYSMFITVQEQGAVANSSMNLTLLLTTTSGVFGTIATVPTLKKVTTERAVAFCKQRSWDPDICSYFTFKDANGMNLVFDVPLRMPFWYPETWRWSNETELSMSGLTHTLLLKVTSENLLLDKLQQKFVVSYSNAHKSEIPVPKIYNCGKHIESPVTFSEKQNIDLASVMLFTSEDKFEVNIVLEQKWKIKQPIHFEWKAFRVELYSQPFQFEYYYIGKSFWRVSPFSWRNGLYIVRLETRTIDLVRTDNYGQCYLKVVLDPLVASISGGAQKIVNIEDDLVLDPSGSRDPNQPPGESKLRFTMSCDWVEEAICQQVYKDSIFYDGGLTKPPFRYSPKFYKLEVGKVYNFTLEVELRDMDYKLEPAYAHQLVIFKHFPSNFSLKSLEIECFYNCYDSNPKEIVYFKLKGPWNLLQNSGSEFTWLIPVNYMYSLHPHILIIPINEMKENSMYTFKGFSSWIAPLILLCSLYPSHLKTWSDSRSRRVVKLIFLHQQIEKTDMLAIYELTTSMAPKTHCNVEPETGIRHQTFFNITCSSTGFVDGYEFYDKKAIDDSEFSGRMLAFQKTGDLENLILIWDRLEVHTFGKNGIKTVTPNELELYDGKVSRETLHYWYEMNEMASASNIDILHRSSPIIEFWDPATEKSAVLRMLTWLNMVQLKTGSEAKLWTSTLHEILVTVFNRFDHKLSLREGLQAAVTLAAISRTLVRESSMHIGRQFTFKEYHGVFSYLLDCIYIVLEGGKEDIHGHHQKYNELKYSSQVKTIHKSVMDTLRSMGMILMSKLLPEQENAEMSSVVGKESGKRYHKDIVMFAKVTYPSGGNFTDIWPQFRSIVSIDSRSGPVVIPAQLNIILRQMGYFVGFQITVLERNRALWWQRKLKSTIIYVQMCFREDVANECTYPQWLESPIWVNFYIYNYVGMSRFHDENVTRLSDVIAQDVLDLEIKVFRIDLPARACLSVYFRLQSKHDELIVLIKKGIRPGYRSVEMEGKVISWIKNVYHVKCEANDQPEFYYMVVLAGERVLLHDTLHFKYKAIYRLCLSWSEKLRQWESDGSSIVTREIGVQRELICQWSRLSIFASEVEAAPVTVDQLQDFVLQFSPWSNRTTFLKCLAFFALVFMLGFILAWWTDRHQCAKRFVVVLSDNFPSERYGYLVCVMTGARFKAGTDANVGIRIFGTKSESRAHVLRSEEHDVMGWLGEDWFLLFTNQHLGTLDTLHVWLDNTGKSPSWFCNSILVFDMKMENYYIFSVNQWIALSTTKLPEAIIKPVQLADLTKWYKMFKDHLKSGFRQRHLWMATVFRHPRDPVKRTDRLMVIVCFTLVSMSTSLLLVIFSERGLYLENKEDLPTYSVKWIDIVISLITFTVSTIFAELLLCVARKTYKVWYCSKEEERFKVDYLSCGTAQFTQLIKEYLPYTTYHSYRNSDLFEIKNSSLKQFIALHLMGHPLIPVQLYGDKSAVALNLDWCCRVILLCLLIVLTTVILCVVLSDHLSPNRVKGWLTVVAITTILHAVVYLPLKILVISLILTFAFDRIIYKDFYIFNPKDCQRVHLHGNTRHLRKIIRERMEPKYKPNQELAHEAHQLKRQRSMKWRKIVEFLFVFMFIIVLSKFLSKDNLRKYFSNSHLRSMINASRDKTFPSYYSIYNLTQFENFLQESFYLSMFKFMWYNMKLVEGGGKQSYKIDWCYDNTHRMMGQPHFRQFRVKPGYCHIPKMMENIRGGILDCAAAWGSREAEDTRVYKPFWIHPETLDNSYWGLQFNHSYWSQQFIANWLHAVNWSYTDNVDYTYYGRSGNSYPPGGYNRSLWRQLRVVLSVQDDGWVEHHTRAVLTQVALGNANTRYLTQVTMVAEQTVAGEFITSVTVQSVDVIFEIDFWMVLLVAFTTLHFVRIFAEINSVGLVGYFKKGYRIYELLLIVFLSSSIIELVKHYFTAVYLDQGDVIEDIQYQFYKKSNHLSSARTILCVTFVLTVIYIYISHFWRFGQHFLNFSHALMLSFKTVIWLGVILILFLSISCSFICYLINAFVAVVLNLNLIWKFTFVKVAQKEQCLGFQILYFTICFGSLITTTLMLVIFIYEFKKAKKYIVNERYRADLVLFLIQEIGGLCKLQDATELRKNYEISIRKTCEISMGKFSVEVVQHSIAIEENPLSTSDENKQDNLEPEIPSKKQYKISSFPGF